MDSSMVDNNQLLSSVLQGRLDFFCSCAMNPLPTAQLQEAGNGSIYYASGVDYAPCNGIIEQNSEREPSAEEIQKAIDFFHKKNLPFIWWSSSNTLENQGFQFAGVLTGIALDISKDASLQESLSSELIEIKMVETEEELAVFSKLATDFGLSSTAVESFQVLISAMMNQGKQVHFLAYVNKIPVGTVTLSTCDSSAGIWSLSTLPEYRNRGVGTALVKTALIEAKKLHYQQVMAILMPKGMAWSLFTKLGFKEVCQFPFYVYGASAEELEK